MTFGQALRTAFDDARIPDGIPHLEGSLPILVELLYYDGPVIFRTVVDGVSAVAWWAVDDSMRRFLVVAHPDIATIPYPNADDDSGAPGTTWDWDANPLSDFPVTGWVTEDQLTYPESTESTP